MRSELLPAKNESPARKAGTAMELTTAAASARFKVRAWKPPNTPPMSPLKSGTKKTTRLVRTIVTTLTSKRLCMRWMRSGFIPMPGGSSS
ncbi:hypothetical protein MFU01_17450 [Myxococcus fulvus]|uniref:Uncharacterized protein n=1 Tax=Myxococcus fulvus TaxID=33 RepID=A0A511SZX9_MYXFU|nr:hypothetical protein MFU01_17450 [Myxococcus fulvus]